MEFGGKIFIKNISYLWLVIFLITGCHSTPPAPIVEGWHQPTANKSDYVVQKGDTLYSIAWAFNMDFRDLAKINNLISPYSLKTGQHLLMSPQHPVVAQQKNSISMVQIPNVNLLPPPEQKISTNPTAKNSIKTVTKDYFIIPSPGKIKQLNVSKRNIVSKGSYKPIAVKAWLLPAQGKIIRGFSLTSGGNHGIEIAGRTGEPVVASAGGQVVYSGSGLRGYGNLIIIKHNDTYLSAYAFNKKLLVKEGMKVIAGQKIALMGVNNAGQARLHFEIRRNGKPVDPQKLVG